jgi:thiol-disulfide isomerase/thioredoxin
MFYQAKNNKIPWEKNLKILNFYSDSCPPCHAFMPNFIEAEKVFWKYYDFIAINSSNSIELFQNFRVMWTPTVIILNWDKVVFNQSWVPNGQELKKILLNTAWITENDLEKNLEKEKKKKWFFGLF